MGNAEIWYGMAWFVKLALHGFVYTINVGYVVLGGLVWLVRYGMAGGLI